MFDGQHVIGITGAEDEFLGIGLSVGTIGFLHDRVRSTKGRVRRRRIATTDHGGQAEPIHRGCFSLSLKICNRQASSISSEIIEADKSA